MINLPLQTYIYFPKPRPLTSFFFFKVFEFGTEGSNQLSSNMTARKIAAFYYQDDGHGGHGGQGGRDHYRTRTPDHNTPTPRPSHRDPYPYPHRSPSLPHPRRLRTPSQPQQNRRLRTRETGIETRITIRWPSPPRPGPRWG